MTDEQKPQRSASEVLLSMETKLDILLQTNRSLDLNFKVLSNKFNQILQLLNTDPMIPQLNPGNAFPVQSVQQDNTDLYSASMLYPKAPTNGSTAVTSQTFNVGNVNTQQLSQIKVKDQLEIPSDMPLTMETAPVGFARTSRPETHMAQEVGQIVKNTPTPSIQLPQTYGPKESANASEKTYPVQQRVTDAQGKSLFMCDVQILDSKGVQVWKGRTNGVGKWSAALKPSTYKVNVKKHDSIAKKTIDVTQNITVNSMTGQDLPVLICK